MAIFFRDGLLSDLHDLAHGQIQNELEEQEACKDERIKRAKAEATADLVEAVNDVDRGIAKLSTTGKTILNNILSDKSLLDGIDLTK